MNHKNDQNNIWLLLDDRPGNCSQVLGIGKALELKHTLIKFNYINYLSFQTYSYKKQLNT